MKKILLGFSLLALLLSCGDRKTKMDPFTSITEMMDSISHRVDTLQEAGSKEEPKPMEADEFG